MIYFINNMSTIKSVEKIIEYMANNDGLLTPTSIQKGTNLSHQSVSEAIEFMSKHTILEIISNGHVRFVRLKEGRKDKGNEETRRH